MKFYNQDETPVTPEEEVKEEAEKTTEEESTEVDDENKEQYNVSS